MHEPDIPTVPSEGGVSMPRMSIATEKQWPTQCTGCVGDSEKSMASTPQICMHIIIVMRVLAGKLVHVLPTSSTCVTSSV